MRIITAAAIAMIGTSAVANPKNEVLWLRQLDTETQCRWLIDKQGEGRFPPREAVLIYGNGAADMMEICAGLVKMQNAIKEREKSAS